MVERKEVDALLADATHPHAYIERVEADTLAALCRAWLAVQDAPVGRLDIVQDDFDGSEMVEMVEIVMDPNHVSHLLHQRVRIVKEVGDD